MSRTLKTDALVAELRRRGVQVLTHDQWGSIRRDVYAARLDSRPHALLPDRPVDTLWNHITVTFDDGVLVGDFKADMREVERIGYERFGSGVSYNVLVDANATRPRVAIGQFLEAKGTHTVNDKGTPGFSYDQNAVALAVAWVGVPGNRLNDHAIEAMVQLRAALIAIGALTETYDDVPHSLVAAKDCPTDELRDRLADLKQRALNEGDDMSQYADQLNRIEKQNHRILVRLAADAIIRKRLKAIAQGLDDLTDAVSDDATKKQARRIRADIAALVDEQESESPGDA